MKPLINHSAGINKNANINGADIDGIHGAPYIAAPWILWVGIFMGFDIASLRFADCLVVGNMNCIFPCIGYVIIPTEEHIFQRGRSTTNQ